MHDYHCTATVYIWVMSLTFISSAFLTLVNVYALEIVLAPPVNPFWDEQDE
jgi:hypothetical protein